MEGFSNLAASIFLGWKYGAIGVAWGTLIGAVVGVLTNILYNLAKTRASIAVSQLRYIFEALAAPAACGIPVYLALIAIEFGRPIGNTLAIVALLASFCMCAAVFSRAYVSRWMLGRTLNVPTD
jgi:O-antigen/teichoic acid export membrane protein